MNLVSKSCRISWKSVSSFRS